MHAQVSHCSGANYFHLKLREQQHQRIEVILSLVFIFGVKDFMVREFRLAQLPAHSLTSIIYTCKLIVCHKVIQTHILREVGV